MTTHNLRSNEKIVTPEVIAVYPIGTAVLIGHANDQIPALIVEVLLSGNGPTTSDIRVQYKVAWWSGRDRKTEWLGKSEFRLPPGREVLLAAIGFRGTNRTDSQ